MTGRGLPGGLRRPGRLGPIIAGLAGIGWFIAELAPQFAAFPDTDDPSVGLAFVAAHPTAWAAAGLLLFVASLALIVAVIATGDRLASSDAGATEAPDVARRAVTVAGLMSASFLFGDAVVRYVGGPLLYVHGLNHDWGEAAYLVTQFVGVHVFAQGGVTLLAVWIISVAWLGARRRAISPVIGILALLPSFRLLAVLAPWGILPEDLWIFFMAAIPSAFLWLILLGVSSADRLPNHATRAATHPAEATAIS